jgi:hypothetical protein
MVIGMRTNHLSKLSVAAAAVVAAVSIAACGGSSTPSQKTYTVTSPKTNPGGAMIKPKVSDAPGARVIVGKYGKALLAQDYSGMCKLLSSSAVTSLAQEIAQGRKRVKDAGCAANLQKLISAPTTAIVTKDGALTGAKLANASVNTAGYFTVVKTTFAEKTAAVSKHAKPQSYQLTVSYGLQMNGSKQWQISTPTPSVTFDIKTKYVEKRATGKHPYYKKGTFKTATSKKN